MKNDHATRSRGIIYCATGNVYIQRATLSAKSMKKHSPGLDCCVFTNGNADSEIWDKIIPIEKTEKGFHQYMLDKLIVLNSSPYIDTLYLDSDTYILDDLTELFQILEQFDLAICHGHDRQKRYLIQHGKIPVRGTYIKAISDNIPYSFAPLQGGLFLFRQSERMNNFLKKLLQLYIDKDFYDDQVSIRELLWSSDLRFYILPPEYNFNSLDMLKYWKKFKFKHAKPKIFHYTQNKKGSIDRLVLSVLRNRTTDFTSI